MGVDLADCFACPAVMRYADKKKSCHQSMELTFARGRTEEGTSADMLQPRPDREK